MDIWASDISSIIPDYANGRRAVNAPPPPEKRL